jgi:hypothetical protein
VVIVIPHPRDFMEKAQHALMHIRTELPECCSGGFHEGTELPPL